MAINPIPDFTFENWLNGEANIKWEDIGLFHGLYLKSKITKEEFEILEKEGDKIYDAQLEAFNNLVEYNIDFYKQNFKEELSKVKHDKIQFFKETEILNIQKQLNQDYETFKSVLQDEKDFDGLDGNTYKRIKELHNSWTINHQLHSAFYLNKNSKFFALYAYLTWLKNQKDLSVFLTLENYFSGNMRDYTQIMEKLTKERISLEDKTGILIREGNRYKWTYKKYAGLQYLGAFIYTLNENGWIDLTDENDKLLSNEKIATIITNTYNYKISKTDVAFIKNGIKPKEKYLLPFKDIPLRNKE